MHIKYTITLSSFKYMPNYAFASVQSQLSRASYDRYAVYIEFCLLENLLSSSTALFQYFQVLSTCLYDAIGWTPFGGLGKIIPTVSQEIKDALQEQKLVLVTWIDLQKAFDKVWMEGLLVRLLRNGIASNMFNWIKSYLYNCSARVPVDRVHSKKIQPRHGVS